MAVVRSPGVPRIEVFTVSGTWHKPNNVRAVWVRAVGAGGGGGNAAATVAGESAVGGGGGGGGYSESLILAANLNDTESVIIGEGGVGGAGDGNSPTSGSDSSFGSHLTAGGGSAATNCSSSTTPLSAGGQPGAGTGGQVNTRGSSGYNGRGANDEPSQPGYGGASTLAPYTVPADYDGTGCDGTDATGYGAGGSGAMNSGSTQTDIRPGGRGGPGVVIVMSYF